MNKSVHAAGHILLQKKNAKRKKKKERNKERPSQREKKAIRPIFFCKVEHFSLQKQEKENNEGNEGNKEKKKRKPKHTHF